MNDFVAFLTHELRSPLNALNAWLEVLKGASPDSDQFRKALRGLEASLRTQQSLLDDMGELSRLAAGKASVDLRRIDAAKVVARTAESHRPEAERHEIQLLAQTPDTPVTVMGDRRRLEQALRNLLVNAFKFTPAGGRIEVAAARRDTQAEITVSDNGRGITPEMAPHVFERFFTGSLIEQRNVPLGSHEQNFGLGLYVVRLIVEAHHGAVQAESAGIDRGTTFRIRLPVAPALGLGSSGPPRSRASSAS
jgi:signal transduction histidine kinase